MNGYLLGTTFHSPFWPLLKLWMWSILVPACSSSTLMQRLFWYTVLQTGSWKFQSTNRMLGFTYSFLIYLLVLYGFTFRHSSRIYYIYLTNNCLSTRYEVSTSHNVVTNSHARSWLAVIVRKKMQISWDDIFRLYQMVHALTIKPLPICILALMIKP